MDDARAIAGEGRAKLVRSFRKFSFGFSGQTGEGRESLAFAFFEDGSRKNFSNLTLIKVINN